MSFTASTTHISHLAEVFLALSGVGSQGLVIIGPTGIVVYCENNHILNCQAIIDISLFGSYNLAVAEGEAGGDSSRANGTNGTSSTQFGDIQLGDTQLSNSTQFSDDGADAGADLRFGIDLSLINHSFEVLNSNKDITCYLSYNGEGSPFIIEFEDTIMSERIEFLTFYVDIEYPYDVPLEDQDKELVVNYNDLEYEMILKSDILTNILQDLHQINTSELYIYLSKSDSQLQFISNGPIGLLKLIYPNEKTILEKMELYLNQQYISNFKFLTFIKCFKAVRLSNKSKLLRDSNGIFSIQLICKDSNNNTYSGTLITVNMLELDQQIDISNLNQLFNDVEDIPQMEISRDPQPKRRRVESLYADIEAPLFL